MFRPRCSTKMHHATGLSATLLQSLRKTKWLFKLGWGWCYVRSNAKIAKSPLNAYEPTVPYSIEYNTVLFDIAAVPDIRSILSTNTQYVMIGIINWNIVLKTCEVETTTFLIRYIRCKPYKCADIVNILV